MTVYRVLIGLLLTQTALAAWMWRPSSSAVERRPLLPFDKDEVRRIDLQSPTTRARDKNLILTRKDEGWVVDNEFGFPAMSAPIDALLDRLAGLRLTQPISTDPAMHSKLNVASDNNTRVVTIDGPEGESLSFYAGTASRERMYVRLVGSSDVYEVYGLGAWRMSDSVSNYLQQQALQIATSQVKHFQLTNSHGTVELDQTADGWVTPSGAPLDGVQATGLVRGALNLTVHSPVDPALPDPSQTPDLSVRWTLADGSTGSYDARMQDRVLIVHLADDALPLFALPPDNPTPQLMGAELAHFLVEPVPEPTDAP